MRKVAMKMRAREPRRALIAMDAGSMLGLCEEGRRPGGGASQRVASGLGVVEYMREIAILVVVYGRRREVSLSAVLAAMRYQDIWVCTWQSIVTNALICTSHLHLWRGVVCEFPPTIRKTEMKTRWRINRPSRPDRAVLNR